jgi:hypothetical protein
VIPRYQRILFWTLLACSLVMFLFLLHGCQQAHKRLAGQPDLTPIAAPNATQNEVVTLYLANDTDVSITPVSHQVALPLEPNARARTILEALIAQYGQPDSPHPLPRGPAIADVFLFDMPAPTDPTAATTDANVYGQTALINLRGSFADNHPSGVVVETLTIQSIIGTLHAALPLVGQIRFLVDGKPRETLAGHASLARPYPAVDTANRPGIAIVDTK